MTTLPLDGKLTDEQRNKFGKWMESKAEVIGKCPICRQRNWVLIDHLIHAPIFYGNMTLLGGPSYPFVGLFCQHCGNTQLINAVISGIVPNEGSPSEPNLNQNGG